MVTRVILFAYLTLVIFYPTTSFAQQETYHQWSEQAEAIYTLVEEEQFAQAREKLTQLANSFSQSNQELSPMQLQILSDQIIAMDRELTRLSIDWEQIHFHALRLLLAFDALSHHHQPLWKQYQGSTKRLFAELQGAVQNQNKDQFYISQEKLLQNFQLIQPALIIAFDNTAVRQAESQLKKIAESGWENRSGGKLQQELKQLEIALDSFFLEDTSASATEGINSSSIVAAILWGGGLIAFVLTYVGWRKYQGEQIERSSLQQETL